MAWGKVGVKWNSWKRAKWLYEVNINCVAVPSPSRDSRVVDESMCVSSRQSTVCASMCHIHFVLAVKRLTTFRPLKVTLGDVTLVYPQGDPDKEPNRTWQRKRDKSLFRGQTSNLPIKCVFVSVFAVCWFIYICLHLILWVVHSG